MFKPHRRELALFAIALGAVAVAGCTRSASTPVTGGLGSATPAALTGQQATMEAVRAALLTQTAQALARSTIALPTTAPTNVPTISLATATPPPGSTPLPFASATPTGGAGCPYTYIVEPDDTGLFRIAIDLGYDPEFWIKIAEANNLTEPWLVYPGDELTIPCP